MHRSRLPILHPCDQDWAKMSGTGATRHCAACEREVIDLSAMPAVAAIDALIAREGRACIRYRIDAAGEIEFAAAPRRVGAIAAAALALSACAGWNEDIAPMAPGEADLCISEDAEGNECERVDLPGEQAAPVRPSPRVDPVGPVEPVEPVEPVVDRDFTALIEVAPSSMGDSAGLSPAQLVKLREEAAPEVRVKVTSEPSDSDYRGIEMGMMVVYEESLEVSLFDRKSKARPGRDMKAIAALLRAKRELRREQRLGRRVARRG